MMKVLQILSVACLVGLATPADAQDLPDTLIAALDAQGFVVTSKRYTWLGRIFVEATNGKIDRAILIARGSGQILQDNWILLAPTAASTVVHDDDDDSSNGTTDDVEDGSNAPTPPPSRPPRDSPQGKPPSSGGRP